MAPTVITSDLSQLSWRRFECIRALNSVRQFVRVERVGSLVGLGEDVNLDVIGIAVEVKTMAEADVAEGGHVGAEE